MFLRLRQICLVAQDLTVVEQDLVELFDLSPCHSDPRIATFGLRNSLLPVGTSFIELVSPMKEGTPAGRYLDRRGGDGGYMAIFDSDEIDAWRSHIANMDVREAAFLEFDGYEGIQMHPRDTGGPLLEINRTANGADLNGNYWPAGEHWQDHVRTSRLNGVLGVEIQSPTPDALAQKWAAILKRKAPDRVNAEWHVTVDNAVLRFINDADGRGERLSGIDFAVNDLALIRDAATDRGLKMEGDVVFVGGVRCRLLG